LKVAIESERFEIRSCGACRHFLPEKLGNSASKKRPSTRFDEFLELERRNSDFVEFRTK